MNTDQSILATLIITRGFSGLLVQLLSLQKSENLEWTRVQVKEKTNKNNQVDCNNNNNDDDNNNNKIIYVLTLLS